FRQVARGPRTADFTVWSLHSSGWTALRLSDMNRARDTFAQFQSATPAELEAWARHGLGLANYALGRPDDAVAAWTALAAPAPARPGGRQESGRRGRDAPLTAGRAASDPHGAGADRVEEDRRGAGDRAGSPGRHAHERDPRVCALTEGRGVSGRREPRRSAHAVRAVAADGAEQRDRLVRGLSPGPGQFRAA